LIYKWTVYALVTALFLALQSMVLCHIQVWGLMPFLYPVLPAVVASYEGLRRGPTFALCLGVVCDLLYWGPFSGFYTMSFTLLALIAALIAENAISPGFLCSLVVSAAALAVTGAFRLLLALLSGAPYLALMGRMVLGEAILTLPCLIFIHPVYRAIHIRCASEY
jgi:rod shape-determining protein MreD